jgi:hypothetical protein
MDKPGLVTSTGPVPMAPSIFEKGFRRALAKEAAHHPLIAEYSTPIEYVHDGNIIPESKVFGTDSQKGK